MSISESLVELGLTQLEADIYRFLLRESPATGYRIAQGLGKPTANVYKALESLSGKSALLIRKDDPRRYSPVPVDELLSRLQREFERHLDRTRQALRRLPGPAQDDGIYHLAGREAVLDRCRSMLHASRARVLLDAFPIPLRNLTDAIGDCVERHVGVEVKCYEPTTIDGVQPVVPPDHEDVRRRWPVQWLNLVVDAEEVLIAVFDQEGIEVLEAVWTRNPWIAFILGGTLAHEIAFTAVRAAPLDDLGRSVRRGESLFAHESPGENRLRELLGLVKGRGIPASESEEAP